MHHVGDGPSTSVTLEVHVEEGTFCYTPLAFLAWVQEQGHFLQRAQVVHDFSGVHLGLSWRDQCCGHEQDKKFLNHSSKLVGSLAMSLTSLPCQSSRYPAPCLFHLCQKTCSLSLVGLWIHPTNSTKFN